MEITILASVIIICLTVNAIAEKWKEVELEKLRTNHESK